MADIVSAVAIKFSNERVRPSSDLLAQAYYLAVAAGDRWGTLGSGQPALDQMQVDLRTVADRMIDAFLQVFLTEKNWFMSGVSALFPNDASPVFDNGGASAQDPNRPLLTGAGVNNVVTRCMEFQNWLLSQAGSFLATRQVETATAAGTIGTGGNATVIVTANLMTGSPRTVPVAVTAGDSAATWAGKVRTALAADATVAAFFTVSGTTTAIILTAITPAANDSSMNVSLANGTNTGITAAPTSANTTAGVAHRMGTAFLNTVLQCSSFGPATIVLTDAQNLITRCTELKTEYQASSSAKLTTLLTAAVNPNR
jgi:hypothetical protein